MLAAASLIGLVLVIVLANVTKKNVGLLGIAAAFILGFFVVTGDNGITTSSISGGCKLMMGAFPDKLFFRIAILSIFFNIAATNDTMKTLSAKMVAMLRGKRKLIPFVFFLLGHIITALGVDGTAVQAVLLPLAALLAVQEGISFMPMGVLCTIGVWGGIQSPIARTGLVCEGLANDLGYTLGASNYIANLSACIICAVVVYFFLKGYKITDRKVQGASEQVEAFTRDQILTLAGIAVFAVMAIMGFEIAAAGGLMTVVLLLTTKVDQKKIIAMAPWSVLLMITGMSMYVEVMTEAGGIDLIVNFFSSFTTHATLGPCMTLAAAGLSFVSSAAGVVMPTFYPTVPGLAAAVGANPAFIMNAVSIGSHATSISPVSTGGGMIMSFGTAAFNGEDDERKAFMQLIYVALVQTVIMFILSWTPLCGIAIPNGNGFIG